MKELIEEMWEANYGNSLPRQRFFTPTEKFWQQIPHLGVDMLIDCGTGDGDLPKEAQERGIKMGACDIIHREGNGPVEVHVMPAHMMPFSATIWPMVCRPDHSGWTQHLWMQAMSSGAGYVYVGREAALENDVGEVPFDPMLFVEGVGEEGEIMAVWKPEL